MENKWSQVHFSERQPLEHKNALYLPSNPKTQFNHVFLNGTNRYCVFYFYIYKK